MCLCVALLFSTITINQVNAKRRIALSTTWVTLFKGKTTNLKLLNVPKNGKVTWTTSNKYSVTVGGSGNVTAINAGKAMIVAQYNNRKYVCTVAVPDVSYIALNAYSLTLAEGQKTKLIVSTGQKVTFFSRNEHIATVNEKGEVTGVNPGTADIMVTTGDNQTKCTVVVKESPSTKVNYKVSRRKAGIRRATKKNKVVYEKICWANNKEIRFKLAGVNESQIRKCVWKTKNKKILTKPKKTTNKIIATAKTVKKGTTSVSAVVTFKNGTKKTYNSRVYVSAPKINTKNLLLLGESAGSNRQQYVTFSGLKKYSHIKWNVPANSEISTKVIKNKLQVMGAKTGSGTIKVTVDGRVYKVKFNVFDPAFGKINSVLEKGRTATIVIDGIGSITPEYTVRNKNIATVDDKGNIRAVKAGVTYIDVTIGNYNFYYRIEVAATGMPIIINRATYIVNNWTYSQPKRMQDGFYDCSSLVWKGYKAYNNYQTKLGSKTSAYCAADLFDYLYRKNQIVHFGYLGVDYMQPGDLIFYGDYDSAVNYSTPGRTLDIYHVSMYAGNGKVVEKGGQTINYNNTKHIVGVGRVVY